MEISHCETFIKPKKRYPNGYGGHSGRATPVLVPNTEVKPSSDSGCTAIGGNLETLPAHFPQIRPGGVDRTIIRDCHSRDSGSNPGPGVALRGGIIGLSRDIKKERFINSKK